MQGGFSLSPSTHLASIAISGKITSITTKLKIGVVHYRVGHTDGVSLEIAKRKKVLESLGHEVHFLAGHFSNGPDYIIPELEVDLPEVVEIKENMWSHFNTSTLTPDQLIGRINQVSDTTKQQFLKYHQENKFDLLLVHNIFSFSLHVAAAKALAEIITENNIPAIATNHDYYWERSAYLRTTSSRASQFLASYVPFADKRIRYISLSRLARQELLNRRGLESDVLGDFLDFSAPPWLPDPYNRTFLRDIGAKANDLIILQATRLVPRKGISLAVDLAAALTRRRRELAGRALYNGKRLTAASDVVLILAGSTEKSDRPYRDKLEQKISALGVKARFADAMVAATRRPGSSKIYSLWDCYAHADLITYPSLSEGWGNQFLETMFARKPIVLFEYPVFKADIKGEGYHYGSLGDRLAGTDRSGLEKVSDQVIQRAASAAARTLLASDTKQRLEHNFATARRHHDLGLLKNYLVNTIDELLGC